MRSEKNNLYFIIGCGSLGAKIALNLAEQGKEVAIIDKNKNALNKLGEFYGGITIEGDATDIEFLKKCEIEKARAVVSVTDDDNTNIAISQAVKEIFGINRVISRLYDNDKECVYKEFNIATVCPELLSAREINKILTTEDK